MSFCPFKNRTKVKEVNFQGESFFAFPLGPMAAIGVNFDPYIASDSKDFEQCADPRLIVWETMPEARDFRTPSVFEIRVGQPNPKKPETIFVKEGESSFPHDMHQFSRIISTAEEIAGRNLVRV